ncbi:MAG TPA: molybdenum cofactor biosynthesis protein MoaE [bacterium]|jgi:molybdopterin synthase catalytic subunit|nr:molybdenum cofactor biosynthesis protein MoaE [bacterium]
MRIAVRTFAAYRQAVGSSMLTLDLPEGITPRGVWSALAERYPALRRFPPPSAYAVNDEFIDPERPLADADEVALIPPVSGGAATVALTREPIDPAALLAAVADPRAGAVALFCGTVREHSRERTVQFLEYEAYEVLAEREMRRIAAEAASRWPALGIAVVHRLGHLEVGEISVAIAVASPHRADAFAAARFIIDTLKQTVPIWKKEVWAGGEEWIGSGA